MNQNQLVAAPGVLSDNLRSAFSRGLEKIFRKNRRIDVMNSYMFVLVPLGNRSKNWAALGMLGFLSVLLSFCVWGLPVAVLAQEDITKEFQVQAGGY